MGVQIDREQWSDASKRSYAYHYQSTTYEDIAYQCRKCKSKAVFTAEEQKQAYEVKKQYIWKRRTLCSKCNGELYNLKLREKQLQERWARERKLLKDDRNFLTEWLSILNAIPQYGQRSRSSMQKLLEKLLQENF